MGVVGNFGESFVRNLGKICANFSQKVLFIYHSWGGGFV